MKNLVNDIDSFVTNKEDKSWHLGENIHVGTRFFNNKQHVDIRKFMNIENSSHPVPTKCGVFLQIPLWEEVKEQLPNHSCKDTLLDSPLGKTTVEVLAVYLTPICQPYQELECDGCENDWPAQKDHVCLMEDDFNERKLQKLRDYLDYLHKQCDIHTFTLRLAERCANDKIEITRTPRYLLQKVVFDWSTLLLLTMKNHFSEITPQQD